MLTEILPPLHPHPPTPRQRITGQIITIEYRNYVQSLIKMRGFYSSIPLFPNFSFCILSSHVHPWERQSACTGRDIIWFCETKYESIQQRCWHITQTATDLGFAQVQYSQDQCPESSMFRELFDLDVVTLPLLLFPLLPPPPRFFELPALLQPPWESTSDRPFSKAPTKFSKQFLVTLQLEFENFE